MEQLQLKAKANPQRVVLPEAGEEKILHAARQVRDMGIAYPMLVGKPETVSALVGSIGVSLDGITVVDHTDQEKVEHFVSEYAVGLISFDSAAKHVCEPTYDIGLLKDRIRKMHAAGTTNMAEAIRMAHDHLRRLAGMRVIVIATDGVPNNVQDALREGMRAKEDKIDIITIGTDDADLGFLRRLATRAELGKKVAREVFSQAITQASRLLPSPKSIMKR
jgi:hypothetical protein